MKRLAYWLHGLPLVIYLGIGLVAYTKLTAWRAVHRADDERFVAQTVRAFKEINDENARLQRALARTKVRAAGLASSAAALRRFQDSVLAQHPIASAPPACAPWVASLVACRAEADSLKIRGLILEAGLDSARAQLAKADTTVTRGRAAVERTRCGFPCLRFSGGPALMLDAELKLRKGIAVVWELF